MTSPFEWPALQVDRRLVPPLLEYERGVWGKVHGAATDFRWIAQSEEFARGRGDLHIQLNLGAEDLPAEFPAWRTVGGCSYAVHAYPSRAIDARGRRGFLEKQVLEWRRPVEVPAALAAFFLLPQVARMDDSIWWDHYATVDQSPLEIYMPILRTEHPPIVVSESELAAAIDRGRNALREAVDVDTLAKLYDDLLHRGCTVLSRLRQPLPPEALGALLLPLNRELADRISLAGWVPTSHASLAELSARWEVLIAPADDNVAAAPTSSRDAHVLAEQLLTDGFPRFVDPRSVRTPVAVTPEPVASKISSQFDRPRPGIKLELAPPASNAPELLSELYEFARDTSRRWLTPDELKTGHVVPYIAGNDAAVPLLSEWVRQVAAQYPPYANAEQWSVKVDLLRAAALALAPYSETVRDAGIPGPNSRVPALLFALMFDGRKGDILAGVGTNALHDILMQSVTCRVSEYWAGKIRRWVLEYWKPNTGSQTVRNAISAAYASHLS
jgi:hypothetical protein